MKKLLALLLAAVFAFCFAACGDDPVSTQPAPDEFDNFSVQELTTKINEAIVSEVATNAEGQTEIVTEIVTEIITDAAAVAPTTTAEILEAYNNAVNSAYDAKAGFSKERSTFNESIQGGGVVFSAAKDLIYKFMGVGADNKYTENVTKGNWESEANMHYLRKSTLTEADITSATCQAGSGQYLITLEVKGGSSRGSKDEKSTKAPIDKCGICVGNEDKGYYDHKTGEVIYDALAGTYAGADISESYNNAKIFAIINAETGKIMNLKVEFNIDVNIDVKVASGTATATTNIIYRDFVY